ncbi:MAG: efflux RND transporter periplasmic adaptor subunit [Pseudomonadota bacterium]
MNRATYVATLAVACSLAFASSWAQPAGSPSSPVKIDEVVQTEVAPTVPITGTVHSRNDIQITAAVDGRLEFVAEPGTLLRAGEEVARIELGPLRLQLDELRAQATRARAQLAYLEKQLERENQLMQKNSTAANQRDETESNRDIARSDLRIAETRILQTEDLIERAVIRARFDGIVTARDRREGETVGRGAVLARLTDVEHLEVRALAPLHQSARVQPGDELRLFGYESSFAGTVRAVIPPLDARTQALELRIDLPAGALGRWSLGQLVSVAVPQRIETQTLAVDRDALILREEGTFVYRVNEDGTADRVRVDPGVSVGRLVAIRGELAAGDRVVVRGGETLSPGQSVTIVGDPPAAP